MQWMNGVQYHENHCVYLDVTNRLSYESQYYTVYIYLQGQVFSLPLLQLNVAESKWLACMRATISFIHIVYIVYVIIIYPWYIISSICTEEKGEKRKKNITPFKFKQRKRFSWYYYYVICVCRKFESVHTLI